MIDLRKHKLLLCLTLFVVSLFAVSCSSGEAREIIRDMRDSLPDPVIKQVAEDISDIAIELFSGDKIVRDLDLYAIVYHEMGDKIDEYYISDANDLTSDCDNDSVILRKFYVKVGTAFAEKTDRVVLYGNIRIEYK